MATTLNISANRLNMIDLLPIPSSYGLRSGIFNAAAREPLQASGRSAKDT